MSPRGPSAFPSLLLPLLGAVCAFGIFSIAFGLSSVLLVLCSAPGSIPPLLFSPAPAPATRATRLVEAVPFRCVAEEAKLSHFLPKRYPKLGSDSRFALAKFAARKARMAELKRGKRFMRATASAR